MATPINCVVDLSHHNKNLNFSAAFADGIRGIVHKATQGDHFLDRTYTDRKPLAIQSGHMWGAYHFGVGNVAAVRQADWFLKTVKPDPKTLMVLDFEWNPVGADMTLAQAEAFVSHVHEKTGRWPGLYTNYYYAAETIGAHKKSPILRNCWLWLNAFRGSTNGLVPVTWDTWTMWQYTDGKYGTAPKSVRGIGPCDRDKFNGDFPGLRRLWGY